MDDTKFVTVDSAGQLVISDEPFFGAAKAGGWTPERAAEIAQRRYLNCAPLQREFRSVESYVALVKGVLAGRIRMQSFGAGNVTHYRNPSSRRA